MPRCARRECDRWRPGLLARLAGLGLYLDKAWYCSPRCLESAARERLARVPGIVSSTATAVRPPSLGCLLTRQNTLSKAVVERALADQEETGLRLGAQLVRLGAVSAHDVLRALAAQGGVSFLTTIDSSRLVPAPGNLSASVIRLLGLIPFETDADRGVLKVACTAPVPRVAIGALRELTGWVVEPYLVSDEQWPALVAAYGAAPRVEPPACTTVADVGAVAERVVRSARTPGGVQMTEARCNGCLWIRLESGGRTEDLWVMNAQGLAEQPGGGRRPRSPLDVPGAAPRRGTRRRRDPQAGRPDAPWNPGSLDAGDTNAASIAER
jgi:hypothetical protein